MSPHIETIQQWCALLGEKATATFVGCVWTHILQVLTLLLVQVVMIQFGVAVS